MKTCFILELCLREIYRKTSQLNREEYDDMIIMKASFEAESWTQIKVSSACIVSANFSWNAKLKKFVCVVTIVYLTHFLRFYQHFKSVCFQMMRSFNNFDFENFESKAVSVQESLLPLFFFSYFYLMARCVNGKKFI